MRSASKFRRISFYAVSGDFPKPFKMLFSVLAIYIKGQIKLRVMIKLPAREL